MIVDAGQMPDCDVQAKLFFAFTQYTLMNRFAWIDCATRKTPSEAPISGFQQ